MSATDILRQQGVDFRVIAKFDEKQKDQAKRAGLAAGAVGGLGAAGYGAALHSAGRTGIKNARYDIKNVRADRPANAKLRLKAAGNVIRHGGKLKRTGVVLGLAGLAGAGAAGHELHQEYAGKTLAKLPRHPVQKGYTAGQMSILRQQGLDPISKANYFDYIHSGAGAAATGITIGDAKKKRKRRKVEKADKRRDTSGAVITGAGGAAAATGLVGGGIPGTRPHVPHGQTEGSRAKKMKATFGSVKGGIFGFRTEAHRNFLGEQEAKDAAYEGKHNSRADSFKRGLNAGKIEPEKQIIRHMRGGRIGSNVALVGGAGAAAYGVHRMRHPKKNVSKAQKDTDRGFGAALGAGGVAAVGSEGGARLLEHQGRKWGDRAASSLDEAGRAVPKTGGHTSDGRSANHRVRDVRPKVQPGKIARDPESFLRGKSSAKAHAAGALHGAAAQQRHFAGVYGHMANQIRQVRNPAIGVAAVGGGGLLVSRHLNKKKVEKSLTPQEVDNEIASRKKTKGRRFVNDVRYRVGMKPLSKSLVNGKWLKSSQALHAYKQGQKVGGYTGGKTPGITPQHKEIKEMTEAGAGWMKKVQQNPQESHSTLGMLGLHGLAVRTGGKSSGKSTVLINPQAIARNSTGKRDYRKNKKMVLTHEHAHAEPKRTQYRSHQLNASDAKMGREEGRADYLSQGHHSGYKSPIERSYLDNAPTPEFGAAYRSVQDKMHAAGTKVRKADMEFPMKGEVAKMLPTMAERKLMVADNKLRRAADKVTQKAHFKAQKTAQKTALNTTRQMTRDFKAANPGRKTTAQLQEHHDAVKAVRNQHWAQKQAGIVTHNARPGKTRSQWAGDPNLGPRFTMLGG